MFLFQTIFIVNVFSKQKKTMKLFFLILIAFLVGMIVYKKALEPRLEKMSFNDDNQ